MKSEYDDLLMALETAINYRFGNRRFLEEAMTHRSFLNEAGDKAARDNERLEFFGDAVIDFFISGLLLERFPECREGELTRIRAALVAEESLALLARQIGLGRYLRLGRGEDKSGGREKRSLLADAYEALLAAVYLDGGAEPARRLVSEHFIPFMTGPVIGPAGRDYKTEFQELAQAERGMTPRYVLKDASGPDHDRLFVIQVLVGEECLGEGAGRSKKEAEQAAAKAGIERLLPAGSAKAP
jgi:ribonuclease-3